MLKPALSPRPSVREVFKNDEGAIDLASIMVGIIVIGIIGGVIAATIFAVIPWSQDNGAKQQLDSVATAESAYRGLSSDKGVDQYGSAEDLASGPNGKLFDAPAAGVTIDLSAQTPTEAHYTATITSKSGKVFSITDGGKPTQVAAQSGYAAGINFQTGNDPADPYNYHATTVDDGGASLYIGGVTDAGVTDVYNAVKPLVDPNAPTVSSANDAIYPTNTNQWVISRYNGASIANYFRPTKVILSDANGEIASYVPTTGNELQISAGSDGSGKSFVFNGLIPTSVTSAQQSKITDAANNSTLSVDLVIEGKTVHFHQ